ncbi:MAG: DUF3098 domain-containing protein [Bacteroidales bacterium]|nr:DUF3098 domain-containing protein [Candidatus Equibacterium intestinale]
MANFSVSRRGVRNILIGLIMMIAGFILMMGGGSADLNVFNPQMFSFARTVVAPIVILLGITVIIIGIMKKPKEE